MWAQTPKPYKHSSIVFSSKLIGKDPDAGKDWRQEKGTTKDEMAGWHHWLDGHEFEQAPGDGDDQGSLACCSPWAPKEVGHNWMNELNWTEAFFRVVFSFIVACLMNIPLSTDGCTGLLGELTFNRDSYYQLTSLVIKSKFKLIWNSNQKIGSPSKSFLNHRELCYGDGAKHLWLWKWKWKLLDRVWLFVISWTIQSMEFSRPEYWSG